MLTDAVAGAGSAAGSPGGRLPRTTVSGKVGITGTGSLLGWGSCWRLLWLVAILTDEAGARQRLERADEVIRAAKERHRAIPAQPLSTANQTVPPALPACSARVISATTAAGWTRHSRPSYTTNWPLLQRISECIQRRNRRWP